MLTQADSQDVTTRAAHTS
ncbi:hypothetical protein F383_26688 [Gossypium arboreum]|uniref:Uncharacterized protein n=1 Tax=Gossypium arboreum TaxID=29729 RepID=A0A0B0P986_GOSAR|nr:hypothetical protein F383_26688 [Gossypium arboreum]